MDELSAPFDGLIQNYYREAAEAQLRDGLEVFKYMPEPPLLTAEQKLERRVKELEDRLEMAIAVLRGEHECGDW